MMNTEQGISNDEVEMLLVFTSKWILEMPISNKAD